MLEPYQMSIMHLNSLMVILKSCSVNSNQTISLGILKECHENLGNLINKLQPLIKEEEIN